MDNRNVSQARERIEGFHFFSPTVAEHVGIEAAVILAGIAFWAQGNRHRKDHQYEDRTWVYLSRRAMCEMWGYMTENVIRARVDTLVEHGYILKKQLGGIINEKWSDRTMWYAVCDEDRFLRPERPAAK